MENVEERPSSVPLKAVPKPAPLKNASMNPYIPRFASLDVYANLSGATTGKTRHEPSPKPASQFVNPYVNAHHPKPRPDTLARSASETVLSPTVPVIPATQLQFPMPSMRPNSASGASSRLSSATDASKRSDLVFRPDSRPHGSSSRHKARSSKIGGHGRVLPPNPNPPPGLDSTWIHKGLALKMKFTDFQPGEYIVREDWPGSMKFPDNLDPPNGLDTLRCLFCEKQYSGVNARSMWRRHVSQKHDVVLSGTKTMSALPRSRSRKALSKNVKRSRSIGRQAREDDANRSYETVDDSDEGCLDGDEAACDEDALAMDDSGDTVEGASDTDDVPEGHSHDSQEPQSLLQEQESEPVLVANQDWDDAPPSFNFSLNIDAHVLPQTRPHSTPGPMRRTMSTPAYIPTPSPAEATASLSAFLLPPFGDSTGNTPAAKGKISDINHSSSSTQPSSSMPAPEFQNFGSYSSDSDLANALKRHKAALLPGITLVPALRSPRGVDAFSSPPPRISRRTGTGLTPRPWSVDSPGAGPSTRIDGSSIPGSSHGHMRPSTPDKPRGIRHAFSMSYPLAGVEHPDSIIITPAPAGRKRTMSESERAKWIMALESPGPLSRIGSSPDGASASLKGLSSTFLASSPLQPTQTSTYKVRSYFMPPPSFPGSSSPPIPLADDVKENEGPNNTSAPLFRSHRRMRSHSMFDTPGSSVFSVAGHSMNRPSPRGTGTRTRSSSVDIDTSFSSIEDDPFRSLRIDSSFPFDLDVRVQEEHPERMIFGMGSSPVPGMKRAREDDDGTHRVTLISMSPRRGDRSTPSPEIEIDAFDWDREMSPVKKRIRTSA